jgi:hypothetical protein
MSDPITIGAGLGAGLSLLQGKSPLTGALLGGVSGGMFGGAGGFGSGFGGGASTAAGGVAGGAAGSAATGAAPVIGNAASISPFTPTGVAGIQTANSSLSGLQPMLGQAGEQAIAQNAPMYTGSQGMFDMAKGSTLGYNPSFLGGQGPATFAGGGGYDPSFLGRLSEGMGNINSSFSDLSTRDKLGLGMSGLNMMNQPQMSPAMQPPSPIPTQYNASAQLDPSLVSMVQRKKYPYMIG